MRLYYSLLCPYSRKARISLLEKGLEFEPVEERIWEKSDELIKLEQTGVVPVLVDTKDGATNVLSWSVAIDQYLEAQYPEKTLTGAGIAERCNTIKLVSWFDQKFYAEVTHGILYEKIIKRFSNVRTGPNSGAIRSSVEQLYYHFEYMTWLLERNDWLAGGFFSLADIAAASHISIIDYLDQVPWNDFPEVKLWYAKIKSRPSMRPILKERISSLAPANHYSDLDF